MVGMKPSSGLLRRCVAGAALAAGAAHAQGTNGAGSRFDPRNATTGRDADVDATGGEGGRLDADAAPLPERTDCKPSELFQPLAFVENTQGGPMGANVVIVTHGYLMVLFAPDSGRPPGVLHFYDVSKPRQPVLKHRVSDAHTARFREAHSLPVTFVGGKEYAAIQTIDGVQFWDLTNPLAAAYVSQLDLPGVAGGDYDNVAWQADWQGRYLFVSGANQGIYVIDTQDLNRPTLLAKVPNGRTGGFRVGPIFARGPYLVVSNMDQNGAYSVLDITEPEQPALLDTVRGLPRMYSMTATGKRIYGAGRDGDFLIHSFSDPTSIEQVRVARIEQDSLYVAAQDHFVFSGRQDDFVKIDVRDEENPVIVGQGALGRDRPDHGQVTPLGNLLFVGNDHGSGSALFCHAERDDMPPAVDAIFPAHGSVQQDPRSRVTIVFTDFIDTRTLGPATVAVRPRGGTALPGVYSYNFNTVSFSPNTELEPNATYEIVLAKGGVRDVTGNGLAEEIVARFSTGNAIAVPPKPAFPDAGAKTDAGDAGGAPAISTGGASAISTSGKPNQGGVAGVPSMSSGAPPLPDAAAGPTPASVGGDADCGCRLASTGGSASTMIASFLLALCGLARRRRSR